MEVAQKVAQNHRTSHEAMLCYSCATCTATGIPRTVAALAEKTVKAKTNSFRKLTSMSPGECWGGANQHCAQARSLCYCLKEKGPLETFCCQFVAGVERHPGGFCHAEARSG